MDANVRCRYSGTPYAIFTASAAGPTSSAPVGLHPGPSAPEGPPARLKPAPHYKERPP